MVESRSIQSILIVVVVTVVAAWLGVAVVTNQSETLLKVAAVAGFIICVFLGRRIWLLMVLLVAMNVPLIRGISTLDIGQAVFLGFTAIMFLMRRLPFKLRFGELEFWMILVALTVIQVYLRHPVGLSIFGSSAVGGRPYFAVGTAWLTGMVMSALIVPPAELKWALRLTIIGSLAGAVFTALRLRLGGGGGMASAGVAASTGGVGSSRVDIFGYLAPAIARLVGAFVSPLRACFHPLWAPLILISLALAAASGYRNVVANVGIYYLIAIAYRGGFMSVVIASLTAVFGLGAIALFNLAVPLPANVQRALSPFPGTWEQRYVQAADDSTKWRVEMWEEALFTDFWIQNKLLGDGLGFSSRELQMMEATEGGQGFESLGSGLSAQQETMMLTGGYHSGPVQTIRTVGYVGLAILMLAMIRVAVHGHREVFRCRGTEWYPLALFTTIPSIALPFIFTFVFGEFRAASTSVFFAYGMITLMKRNLPLPAYVKPVRGAYILNRRPKASGGPAAMPG
jgi:hypothetical protein